jgi:hypothetical protein
MTITKPEESRYKLELTFNEYPSCTPHYTDREKAEKILGYFKPKILCNTFGTLLYAEFYFDVYGDLWLGNNI